MMQIIFRALWRGGYSEGFNASLWLRQTIIQKLFRVNGGVPWPVHWSSKVVAFKKINRGNRFPGLSHGCHIDARNGINLGCNVWVGPRVSLISMNHNVNNFNEYTKASPIVIGNNCWLGANSVVLPGVKLGPHTVVAASAVVSQSFPEGNQVIAGVPAKIIKHLPDYDVSESLSHKN